MNTKILRLATILALFGTLSGTAWADYNCNVKINLENISDNSTLFPFTSWSKDVPDFRTSGMAKFAYQVYPGWVDFVPLGPVAMDISNAIPSRTQKCMNEAMKQVFSSASSTSLILDEILAEQGDINAKGKYCTQPQVMEPGEGGQMSGRAGFKFKFSAQKVLNRNNWRHEYATIYPPKSFCASYYEPSCFGEVEDEPFEAEVEEFNGDYIENAFEDPPTPEEQWEEQQANAEEAANSTPPPTEYCTAKPWQPLTGKTIKFSQNGTSAWQSSSTSTFNDISKYVSDDFAGKGRDQYFDRANGIIWSPIPDPSFLSSCPSPSQTPQGNGPFGFGHPHHNNPNGGFGSFGASAPKKIVYCIAKNKRPNDIERYKRAHLDGSKASIIVGDIGVWKQFNPQTQDWDVRAIPTMKTIKYDPRSGVTSAIGSMPANLTAYKAGLKSAASHSKKLAFGDFFGDGKDDAFVIYDNKWWVSNDLTAPWVVVADFATIRPRGLISISDSKTEIEAGAGVHELATKSKKATKTTAKTSMSAPKNSVAKQKPSTQRAVNSRAKPAKLKSVNAAKAEQKAGLKAGNLQIVEQSASAQNIPKLADRLKDVRNLHIADFNGDGIDDIFVDFLGDWYVFGKAGRSYRVLKHAPTQIKDLKFADMNGDNKIDVIEKTGNQLRYYSHGSGQTVNLISTAQPLEKLIFGDYLGDGKADILTAE